MNKKSFSIGTTLSFFVLAALFSCTSEEETRIPVLTFADFEPYLLKSNDTVYVINFWATWCKPCIKEIPDFEKINKEFKNDKVKVYLVSLDLASGHNDLLIPFIKQNKIKSEVLHLTDPDANSWIDKVSPFWSGAIPATVIYKGNSREFYEKTLNYDELKKIVESKI